MNKSILINLFFFVFLAIWVSFSDVKAMLNVALIALVYVLSVSSDFIFTKLGKLGLSNDTSNAIRIGYTVVLLIVLAYSLWGLF